MIFPDLIARRAELTPDRLAMEEVETGRRVTFAGLEAQVGRFAGGLRALGVGAGDRVAILCRNRIEFFALLFACARIEAILVPLNWRSPPAELEPIVASCGPTVLICGHEDRQAAGALAGAAMRRVDLDLQPDWADAAAPVAPRHAWREDQTWYLLHTSGTSGKPKAVIQTVGMAHVNAVNIGHAVQLTGADTTLNFLPLFHTAGINLHTLPALFAGASVLMLPGFDAAATLELIETRRISTFFGVPAVYSALSLHPRFADADLSAVRHWGCGGAPLPDVLVGTFAAKGALVANGMGMTETGPTLFLADPATAKEKIGSVGRPQLLSRVRIVRPDGGDCADGEPGELWIGGPGITPGYWGDPEATATAITPDGWLRSGDLASRDSDGCYHIVGRLKDMFISGAENVYPAEVENVLAAHPAILEAAVCGVPDERWGEVGWAWIQLRPGHALPDPQGLADWCRARLAPYKVPRRFLVVDDFPRTAAGKVQKHLIQKPSASSVAPEAAP
jgi:fatty-acyl-CoA synthase